MEKYQQLELFRKRLPEKPYCTDDFRYGVRFVEAEKAIKRRYIQPNYPWLKTWLVYDIDRPGGGRAFDWTDRNAPTPNIVAENPANLHAHLFYGLEIPIACNVESSKAAKYAAAVQYALLLKLAADPAYTCFTSKNPLHSYWNVRTYQEYLYTLDWLADYLDLSKVDARHKAEDYGIGRNCTLFDHLRRYAYRAVKDYWHDRKQGYDAFFDDLEVRAMFQNNNLFGEDNALFYPEVKHIIKSVAQWTWQHFTPADFIARQKARNRRSQLVRAAAADEKRQKLLSFMDDNPGMSIRDLANETGIPRATVHRLTLKPTLS